MRFVIQRVTEASVKVDGQITGEIGRGFLVFIGISNDDTEAVADKLIKKMLGLRIFEDSEGKTNLSLDSVGGDLLLVSQFTLYADCKKGYRPSFINAGAPAHAEKLYDYICQQCRELKPDMTVGTGIFGADMKVHIENDGPFTIILDSREL